MNPNRLHHLDLSALVDGCHQETRRFRAGLPGKEGCCFELFRRAVEKNDQEAWRAIHSQYYRLIADWIGPHEEIEDLVEITLAKFWRTLRGKRLFGRFRHVGAVLSYLRKCAVSVRLDLERSKQRRVHNVTLDEGMTRPVDTPADLALSRLTRAERCVTLRRWLERHLRDEQERQLVFLSYELGLTPAEILRHCPEHFSDIHEVRRVKERVLKRLRRRTEELQKLLDD